LVEKEIAEKKLQKKEYRKPPIENNG